MNETKHPVDGRGLRSSVGWALQQEERRKKREISRREIYNSLTPCLRCGSKPNWEEDRTEYSKGISTRLSCECGIIVAYTHNTLWVVNDDYNDAALQEHIGHAWNHLMIPKNFAIARLEGKI